MSISYETFDNTGKDIVLAHTHNTKELQVMKCNQFCLCRLRHTLVNWCKFRILEREKQLFNVHAIIQNCRPVSCVVNRVKNKSTR